MKPHRKAAVKKRITVFISLSVLLTLFPVGAIAATNTKSILSKFPLESNDVVSNVLRSIGWSLVCGLHWLVSGLETGIYSINDAIGGFFTSDAVLQLEQKVFPLALALVTLVILFIGLVSMFKPPNFATIIGNFVIGIIVFVSLPYLLSTAYSFTTQAISYINSDTNGNFEVVSNRILVDNITDTTRYDAEGFKSTTLKYKSYFAMSGADISKVNNIDINELVNPDNMKYPDVWKNKLVTNADGSTHLQELGSGQFGFLNIPTLSHYYYRWSVDWFTIFSTLIVTAAALLLSGIKIARLLYELAINQTMAQVMALLDVYTAQRLKKCIQLLISALGTLFAIFFMLQMYIVGTSYVSAQTGIPPIVKFFVMIALAFAVVDGPNLFEQIFGIDAGIRSGMRTLYGLKAAGSLITGGIALAGGRAAIDALKTKGAIGAAKGILGRAGGIAGGVGGAAAGVAKGVADNRQRVSAVKNGFSAAAGSAGGGATGSAAGSVAGAVAGVAAGGGKAAEAGPFGNAGVNNVPSSGQSRTVAGPGGTSFSDAVSYGPEAYSEDSPVQPDAAGPDIRNDSNQDGTEDSGTQRQSSPKDENQPVPPGSIGEYVRSRMSAGVRQSRAAAASRRMYSLTRGSMEKRGDKKVSKAEQKIQKRTIDRSNNNVSEPFPTASAAEKPPHPQKPSKEDTWAERELHSERESQKEEGDLK